MEGADVEDQRSSAASEDIQAHGCASVEIDLGGVSGREVLVCEDHPTDGFEVGREVGSMGEVVLQNNGVDDSSGGFIAWVIELVEREEFGIPLKCSAQNSWTVLFGEDTAEAPADAEHMNITFVIKSAAANCEQAVVPVGMFNGDVGLRGSSERNGDEEEQ